jgi:hypothetical protein
VGGAGGGGWLVQFEQSLGGVGHRRRKERKKEERVQGRVKGQGNFKLS